MKHFLIAGLLAAIGTIALVGPAHAGSKYCYYNPDDPDCYDQGGYSDGGESFPSPPPPPRPRYDDNGYGQDDYDDGDVYSEPRPRRPVYQARSRCEEIGQSLRQYGYRRIRATVCDRNNRNKYDAYRGHTRYQIKVKASSGKIIYAVPQ